MPESKEIGQTRTELRRTLVHALSQEHIAITRDQADKVMQEFLYALATKLSIWPYETIYFLRRYL